MTNGHLKTELLLRLLPRGVITGLESFTRRLPLRRKVHTAMATLFRKPLR